MDDGIDAEGPCDFSGPVVALIVYQYDVVYDFLGDFRVRLSESPFGIVGRHDHYNVFSLEHVTDSLCSSRSDGSGAPSFQYSNWAEALKLISRA